MSEGSSVKKKQWVSLRLIAEVNTLSLYLDKTELTRREIPQLYSTAFHDRAAIIGTEGKVDRVEGFIYAISYSMDTRGKNLAFASYETTEALTCKSEVCLSSCGIG